MKLFTLFATCLFCMSAYAQTPSVEELRAMVDEELSKGNEYAALLNDPDPERAQAAMKIMLNSGDPELVKIALDYGLFSADKAVQVQAVRAYFLTYPRTQIRFSRKGEDPQDYYAGYLETYFHVRENGAAEAVYFANFLSYDEKNECFEIEFFERNGDVTKGCSVRFLQDRMQVRLGGLWWDAIVDEQGFLSGGAELYDIPLTVSIALR